MSAPEKAPSSVSSRGDVTENGSPVMRGAATGRPSPSEYGPDSLAGLSEARR